MRASLYVHIPFCRRKCGYCDFFSVACPDGPDDDYVRSVIKEARVYASFYGISEWGTVYVGGGTPSLLSPSQISDLLSGIKTAAPLSKNAEVTFEMNPDGVSGEFLDSCRKNGVTRLSMGVQALDDEALAAAGRSSSVRAIEEALSLLDRDWKGRLSVDFIAGLPAHSRGSFERQFELLEEHPGIDHVSLYTLTLEEGTPLWREVADGVIGFSSERADSMWLRGRDILERLGFYHYEVSNFSRKGFESRHNIAYWRQENYIGVGAGASGTVYDFAEKKAWRWTNGTSLPAYIDGVEAAFESRSVSPLVRDVEVLDEGILEFEFLMLGLRCLDGVSSFDYERRFGKPLSERLGEYDGVFSKWRGMGLADVREMPGGDKVYSLGRRGILLLNRFLEELP